MIKQSLCNLRGSLTLNDVLNNLAEAYSNAMKYDYVYTLGNNKKQIIITAVSNEKKDFTHIFGLDHLKETPLIIGKNSTQKEKVFKKILNREIITNDIIGDSNFDYPIEKTWNELENRPYSIRDRITLLQLYNDILDETGKGKLYEWNPFRCKVFTTDGISRIVTIKADFVLTLPTGRSENEKYYFFLYRNRRKEYNEDAIYLSVCSAFVDCCNLTNGQKHPYTILQLEKRSKNKLTEILFTHPSYKK